MKIYFKYILSIFYFKDRLNFRSQKIIFIFLVFTCMNVNASNDNAPMDNINKKMKNMPNEEVFQQQSIRITGKVTDKGESLPGVSVVVKGTTTGTTTDNEGNYTINVPSESTILVFSYIGYTTSEFRVGTRSSINVELAEDVQVMEEVVVIGYGTRAKKDLTGAISQISSEEISRQVGLSPQLAMQGKMAGVFVSNEGSSPSARPTIRIRGVTTLGYNDPLYVVDGIPLTEGGSGPEATSRERDMRGDVNIFTMINPNDIETISVLKDASATAIYGVRASNGVILITTKRGAEGKPRVNLTASYGIQNIYKRHKLVSQQEYVDMANEAINNNPSYNKEYWYSLYDKTSPEYMGNNPDYSKDWMNETLIKNAPIQDYNLNISGGTQMSNYSVGAGFANQENAIFKSELDRYSFFLNSDHKLTKWLKVGESFRYIYSTYDMAQESADFDNSSYVIPWQPLFDTDGSPLVPGRRFVAHGATRPSFRSYGYGPSTNGNFLGLYDHMKITRKMMRSMGTFYAELTPVKGLRFRGTYSFDYFTNTFEQYLEPERGLYENGRGDLYEGVGNAYQRRINENINTVKEFLVGYAEKFGDHSVDLIGNVMSQQIQWNNTYMAIDKDSPLASWDQRYIAEGWPRDDKGTYFLPSSSALLGYMGRLSYNFAQKYYLDATVRRDGTSKFGPSYKWGTFPSFAGSWRISSENFMQDISWLNDLKIRGGWGQTGNQETADFAYLALINLNPKASFGNGDDGNGSIYPAAAYDNFPVSNMTWETVTTFSLGFDMIALKNKLSLTAEYYHRGTDGILQTVSIPWTIGAPGSPRVNMAKVNNRGMELQLGYNDRFGDIGFNATANLTTVRNRVSDLYQGQRQSGTIESGYTMNYIRGYKTAGIFQTQAEVDAWAEKNNDSGNMSTKGPGDVIFVDIARAPNSDEDGLLEVYEPDGIINSYDQTYLGKTIPGYYYGFSLGADYKNWDVALTFRGVGDVQAVSSYGLNSINVGQRYVTAYRDRWTPENPSNKIPRAMQGDPSDNNRRSDRTVHNAGFLRFQQFQIGYNFNSDIMKKAGLSNLRCYFSGSNLFVIAPSWPEPDPENITTPTTFTFGVNVSF